VYGARHAGSFNTLNAIRKTPKEITNKKAPDKNPGLFYDLSFWMTCYH